MNKSRAPKIPPILDGGTFIINCKDKAKLFNEFFSKQCTLIINDSIIPDLEYITEARIDSISIKKDLKSDLNHDLEKISGQGNGKWLLTLIPTSKQTKFYFPVKQKSWITLH